MAVVATSTKPNASNGSLMYCQKRRISSRLGMVSFGIVPPAESGLLFNIGSSLRGSTLDGRGRGLSWPRHDRVDAGIRLRRRALFGTGRPGKRAPARPFL